MDKKINEINEMRDALTTIAGEIERFGVSKKLSAVGVASTTFNANKIKSNELNYRSKLKCKRQLIAKLRKDLKAACYVAKTLESVKKKETTALTNQLAYARGECVDLLKRYNNNIDIIGNLHKQNINLYEKFEDLANFIHLGYDELKKLQSDKTDEPTTLTQLKILIESCGQYYADYCNEVELGMRIIQKNRFLKNKINILETHIEAIKEQIKALEYRYLRLQTENNQIKVKSIGRKCLNFKEAYSKYEKQQSIEENENSTDEKRYQDSGDTLHEKTKDFDLTTHLDIVKRLLSDQDSLLEDLTMISKEISIV